MGYNLPRFVHLRSVAIDLRARRTSRRVRGLTLVLALIFGGDAGFPASLVAYKADQELPVAYRVPEEPRIQIGSVDGDASAFFGVTDAIRLRDGGFLVADGGSRALKFFDSRGAYVRSVGRAGDGPGEFRGLYRVVELEDGRIAALDVILARVTLFSADGGRDHTYRLPRGLDGTERGVEARGLLANGSVVGLREVEGAGAETRYGDYPGSLLVYSSPVVQPVLVDTLGRVSSFLKPIPGTETLSQRSVSRDTETIRIDGQFVPIPFLRQLLVAARGDRIAIGPLGGYFVGTFDGDGTMRTSFGGSLPKQVPEGVREAWVDEWVSRFERRSERSEWRGRYEAFLSSGSASTVLPAFTALAIQADGKVWREAYDPELEESDPSRWIVADPSRQVGSSGTVTLPAGFRPYDIGPDYVLGVWKDVLGIEYVRLHDLIEVPTGG